MLYDPTDMEEWRLAYIAACAESAQSIRVVIALLDLRPEEDCHVSANSLRQVYEALRVPQVQGLEPAVVVEPVPQLGRLFNKGKWQLIKGGGQNDSDN